MKITNFLVLSFLLFAFTATSIFPRAVHAEAVIDAFGDEVKAGDRYIIGAASNDFAVTATSPIICNSDVVFSPMSNGLPVIFSKVVESNDSVIDEDSYLNVDFVAPSCRMAGVSTMWKIELRLTARGFVVTTGGVAGLNRFTITKYEGGNNLYQLSYCPISEPICECSCVPLGNVVNRLAPSTIPFPVVFIPSNRASKIEYKMM
ncbi:wound-responsive protein GWIN3-like [Populus alba x Populus x berolinensis]|nr:wound-responsive protein GWIN3-like [Populus alba x Populus x berolinensis]